MDEPLVLVLGIHVDAQPEATQSRNPGTRKVSESEGLTISFVPVDLCHTHKPRGGGRSGLSSRSPPTERARPGRLERRRVPGRALARGADGPGPGSLSRNSRLPRAADSDSDRPTRTATGNLTRNSHGSPLERARPRPLALSELCQDGLSIYDPNSPAAQRQVSSFLGSAAAQAGTGSLRPLSQCRSPPRSALIHH